MSNVVVRIPHIRTAEEAAWWYEEYLDITVKRLRNHEWLLDGCTKMSSAELIETANNFADDMQEENK